MTVRQRIDDLGGRKFVLAAFVILSATVMRVTNHLTPEAYQTVVLFALGLFSTANVAQKATAKEPNGNP